MDDDEEDKIIKIKIKTMTNKQISNYNRMLSTLKRIAKGYQTPDQLRRNSEKEYGLGYEESLEMAYQNLQAEASVASKGVREIPVNVKKEKQ